MDELKIYVAHGYSKVVPEPQRDETAGDPCFADLCCTEASHKLNESFAYCGSGDTIADRFVMYRELTALYWVWKNAELPEWVGFMCDDHYLSFSGNDSSDLFIEPYLDDRTRHMHGFKKDTILEKINNVDMVFPKACNMLKIHPSYGMLAHYVNDCKNQFDHRDTAALRKLIAEKQPRYLPYLDIAMNATQSIKAQCFLMRKDKFQEYCEWLFGLLFALEEQADMREYSMLKKSELARYGRILLTVYALACEARANYRALRVPLVYVMDISMDVGLKPAFQTNDVPILLTSSNYYVPYLATTLCSLLQNSSAKYNYDLIVLERDISKQNKEILRRMTAGYANVSLRFYNINRYSFLYEAKINQNAKLRFVMEVYFRLFALYQLTEYRKIIWLDSDLVVLSDIGKLYAFDLHGKTGGFVRDLLGYPYFETGSHNDAFMSFYREQYKLKNLYDYFNAGVGLIDCDKFRSTIALDNIMELAQRDDYFIKDQDILCELMENEVEYLPDRWNIVSIITDENMERFFTNPQDMEHFLQERENACIVHYAADKKPWDLCEYDRYEKFWEYARQTPFFEEILRRSFVGVFTEKKDNHGILSKLNEGQSSDPGQGKPASPTEKQLNRLFPKGSKRRQTVKKLIQR